VPTKRLPRDKPPNLARRGEIATKTQKQLRPALSCEPLPNHVLLLAHFGAISDVRGAGSPQMPHVRIVLSIRFVGTELGVLLTAKAQGRVRAVIMRRPADAEPCGIERLYTQLGSCHEPAGGAPAAGVGGGASTERILRGTPPNLGGAAGRGGK
jgi:hypothetical protein